MKNQPNFKTINEVWAAIDSGKSVFWEHTGYKVIVEHADQTNEYQSNHFTNRDGKVLSIRCLENYFGGLMDEKELSALFVE